MRTELGEPALEYGQVVRQALQAAGGDELAQAAATGAVGRAVISAALASLGAWELDPRSGADELEAAAAACRAAGWWAIPYPVAERLASPAGLNVDALTVVSATRPAAPAIWLDLRLGAVTLDGRRWLASAAPTSAALVAGHDSQAGLVTELELTAADEDNAGDAPLSLVLAAWTLLGMLDRAMTLTREYVLWREQFGQTLASFQGVQFQLTEAEVERAGAEELAKYALWSVQEQRPDALADALALRLATLEAAEVVFRVAHQLHGAIGFCDETTLSWLSRHSRPLRRLPFGLSASRDQLTRQIGREGLTELFSGAALR
jgi:3-oxo-4-pregnene-20-carboxyl-CoA dehydrogenase alpha subunit